VHVLSTLVRGLEIPVGECLCIARGACPFLCPWAAWCFVYCTSAHVQQNCTAVQYNRSLGAAHCSALVRLVFVQHAPGHHAPGAEHLSFRVLRRPARFLIRGVARWFALAPLVFERRFPVRTAVGVARWFALAPLVFGGRFPVRTAVGVARWFALAPLVFGGRFPVRTAVGAARWFALAPLVFGGRFPVRTAVGVARWFALAWRLP